MKLCLRTIPALLFLLACGSGDVTPAPPPPSGNVPPPPPAASIAAPPAANPPGAQPPPPPPPVTPPTLKVSWLGVQGFLLESADEAVLTAPLYTRPSMFDASTGVPVQSDAALVEASLPTARLTNVRTIIAGHAHYDHLLDVPNIMIRAPQATLFSNTSSQRILDAYSPDRAPTCSGPPQPTTIARSRVVALDDPAASAVDYNNCPSMKPAGAPLDGKWVKVPGAHVRVFAACSEHPDQIAPGIHYAPGSVDQEQCTPPERMDAWREGPTLAFLIDILDPKTDTPVWRIYYQDAPTNAPIGQIPASVLADRRVDLALLNIGSYDKVTGDPENAIAALDPRYALGGHWEDFFQAASSSPAPLPFLDVPAWGTRAQAVMPTSGEKQPLIHNGAPSGVRAIIPQPEDTFTISQ
jgi:L-ascorbate metabolism protein UlaG (beta-lactamase superfamily)